MCLFVSARVRRRPSVSTNQGRVHTRRRPGGEDGLAARTLPMTSASEKYPNFYRFAVANLNVKISVFRYKHNRCFNQFNSM